MIRDYLRHSDLHVTNKYLQATTRSKRLAQGKLVDAILPGGGVVGKQIKTNSPEEFVSPDYLNGRNGLVCRCGNALLDPNGPRLFFGVLCKPFKEMAGTTRLELATSAVTVQPE
jgi:hypothetical protein